MRRRSRRPAIVVSVTTGPGQLTLRVIALTGLLVGALVATALTHALWMLVVTLAGLISAALAVALSVNAMLGQDDRTEPTDPYRRPVALLATVAAATIVLAIALPVEDSAAVSTTTPDAAAAAATVRAFLANAVLNDNAYVACQYLAPSEQQRVAQVGGEGQTCRAVLTATQPSFAGVDSEGSLHALRVHAVVRDGTAYVTAAGVMFELRPATAAEISAYDAPPGAWRIVSGVSAVLH
jgi:hypothetical protein